MVGRIYGKTGIKKEITTASEVRTVDKGARKLNCRKRQIFKSIVFIDEDGKGVIGIVDGESRVDKRKLENVCGKSSGSQKKMRF